MTLKPRINPGLFISAGFITFIKLCAVIGLIQCIFKFYFYFSPLIFKV